MPPLTALWDTYGAMIKRVVVAIVFVIGGVITFFWATTDKTLFWGKYGISSSVRVDKLEAALAKTDSTIVEFRAELEKSDSTAKVASNSRLIDRWHQIKDSPRFTPEEKQKIKDGVFERGDIGPDSLTILLRDR